MTAIETLTAEHRFIESVLDTLERGAQALEAGSAVPAAFFLGAAEFIRGFADDAHHRKEEGVLFRVMARYGFPETEGPVAMMLAEHAEARQLVAELGAAAERLQAGDAAAREEIVRSALAYVELLRHHIDKEDNILYAMAEHAVPPEEHARMADDFARIERDEIGVGARARFEALAAELRRRLDA